MTLIKAVFNPYYSLELFQDDVGDYFIRTNQDLISAPTQDFLLISFMFDLALESFN